MGVRSRWLAISTAALLIALTIGSGLPAGAAMSGGAAQATAGPARLTVSWQPCHRELGFPFECARVRVPLDYDGSDRGLISLALVRLPATDPARRIGSLFLNPGGPGGSGVDFVLGAGPFLYTDEVRARFDLVGFDPRGIGRSTPLLCFDGLEEAAASLPPFPFPVTPAEEAVQAEADIAIASACAEQGGRILDHMSTANVARDLDVLRRLLGDDKLTFAGYSYGSYLGQTYANLFPGRVRALVLDGVLDPVAWATGRGNQAATLPFSTRLRSDAGAQATLEEFFRLCDASGDACAFSGNSAARYAALADRLRAESLNVILPSGATFLLTYADFIGNTLGAMYDSFSWPLFAQALAYIESQADAVTVGAGLSALWAALGLDGAAKIYPNFVEGFPAVACSDSDNPDSFAAWPAAADAAEAQYGYFGRLWTFVSSICAVWTGVDDDRYTGPWGAVTANPVLVVGNTFDPATRYAGAVVAGRLLPRSSLLTVHGWGHTSLFLSQCADQAVSAYLLSVTTPAPGTVCEQDVVPFAAAPQTSSERLAARDATRLPEAVRRSVPAAG